MSVPKALVQLKKLGAICNDYRFFRFYRGIAELCLLCVGTVDSGKVSLKWIKEGSLETNRP